MCNSRKLRHFFKIFNSKFTSGGVFDFQPIKGLKRPFWVYIFPSGVISKKFSTFLPEISKAYATRSFSKRKFFDTCFFYCFSGFGRNNHYNTRDIKNRKNDEMTAITPFGPKNCPVLQSLPLQFQISNPDSMGLKMIRIYLTKI